VRGHVQLQTDNLNCVQLEELTDRLSGPEQQEPTCWLSYLCLKELTNPVVMLNMDILTKPTTV